MHIPLLCFTYKKLWYSSWKRQRKMMVRTRPSHWCLTDTQTTEYRATHFLSLSKVWSLSWVTQWQLRWNAWCGILTGNWNIYLFTWTRDRDFIFITTTLSPRPHFCWCIPLAHISHLTVAESKKLSSAFHLQWDQVLSGVWKSHVSASQQVLVHFSPPYAWSLGCCSSWLFLECPLELLSWYHVQHLQQHWE